MSGVESNEYGELPTIVMERLIRGSVLVGAMKRPEAVTNKSLSSLLTCDGSLSSLLP